MPNLPVILNEGIGIDPADQERVFGMFVQLNRDMRRSQTGLGIGLLWLYGPHARRHRRIGWAAETLQTGQRTGSQ